MFGFLKRALLGYTPGQEHVAIGLCAPQQQIDVWLTGLGAARNVTENCTIVSLRPLRVALAFENDLVNEISAARLELTFKERAANAKTLGKFSIVALEWIALNDLQLGVFQTARDENFCLAPWRLRAHYLYREWELRRRPAHNFKMAFDDMRRHFIFYICPRPVVLVTAQNQTRSNLFPMDLLGPLAGNYFALALRTTSPSVKTMADAGKIVLSDAPFEMKAMVYALGKNHRVEKINWAELPFALTTSPTFQFPVPQAALQIRELEIEQVHEIGSHTLFITRIVSHTHCAQGQQLFHVHEYYHHYQQRAARQETQA